MKNRYFVYILTNDYNTTFYIGVTNNLERRIYEHKNKLIEGFTKKYNLRKLVYFEETNNVQAALETEKRLKNWKRTWKINLIHENNPHMKDLSQEWF